MSQFYRTPAIKLAAAISLIAGALGTVPTCLCAASDSEAAASGTRIRIALVGDSTVTDEEGWGVGFNKCLPKNVECQNMSRGGRSSKSFINEGRWKKCLETKPDYVLIQFGHNDQPGKGPDRETDLPTYRRFMTQYVEDARAFGIKPVLVTSLSMRQWGDDGKIHSKLQPYVNVVKGIAAEKKVPLIDLHARSIKLYETLGKDGCVELSPKNGKTLDTTHLNPRGSDLIGRIVYSELLSAVPEIKK